MPNLYNILSMFAAAVCLESTRSHAYTLGSYNRHQEQSARTFRILILQHDVFTCETYVSVFFFGRTQKSPFYFAFFFNRGRFDPKLVSYIILLLYCHLGQETIWLRACGLCTLSFIDNEPRTFCINSICFFRKEVIFLVSIFIQISTKKWSFYYLLFPYDLIFICRFSRSNRYCT